MSACMLYVYIWGCTLQVGKLSSAEQVRAREVLALHCAVDQQPHIQNDTITLARCAVGDWVWTRGRMDGWMGGCM